MCNYSDQKLGEVTQRAVESAVNCLGTAGLRRGVRVPADHHVPLLARRTPPKQTPRPEMARRPML